MTEMERYLTDELAAYQAIIDKQAAMLDERGTKVYDMKRCLRRAQESERTSERLRRRCARDNKDLSRRVIELNRQLATCCNYILGDRLLGRESQELNSAFFHHGS